MLLDGVAMRDSLRNCPEALRLEDVLETNGLVLFSLDVADYPHATRKVASWVLLGMGRLARQIPHMGDTRALLLVNEVGALGSAARHLRGLVGRARESGLAVVLATQGPSDLEAVDRALLPQVLQDTAWQLAFRQRSPQDAERMPADAGSEGTPSDWPDPVTSRAEWTAPCLRTCCLSAAEVLPSHNPAFVVPVESAVMQELAAQPPPDFVHSRTGPGEVLGGRSSAKRAPASGQPWSASRPIGCCRPLLNSLGSWPRSDQKLRIPLRPWTRRLT